MSWEDALGWIEIGEQASDDRDYRKALESLNMALDLLKICPLPEGGNDNVRERAITLVVARKEALEMKLRPQGKKQVTEWDLAGDLEDETEIEDPTQLEQQGLAALSEGEAALLNDEMERAVEAFFIAADTLTRAGWGPDRLQYLQVIIDKIAASVDAQYSDMESGSQNIDMSDGDEMPDFDDDLDNFIPGLDAIEPPDIVNAPHLRQQQISPVIPKGPESIGLTKAAVPPKPKFAEMGTDDHVTEPISSIPVKTLVKPSYSRTTVASAPKKQEVTKISPEVSGEPDLEKFMRPIDEIESPQKEPEIVHQPIIRPTFADPAIMHQDRDASASYATKSLRKAEILQPVKTADEYMPTFARISHEDIVTNEQKQILEARAKVKTLPVSPTFASGSGGSSTAYKGRQKMNLGEIRSLLEKTRVVYSEQHEDIEPTLEMEKQSFSEHAYKRTAAAQRALAQNPMLYDLRAKLQALKGNKTAIETNQARFSRKPAELQPLPSESEEQKEDLLDRNTPPENRTAKPKPLPPPIKGVSAPEETKEGRKELLGNIMKLLQNADKK